MGVIFWNDVATPFDGGGQVGCVVYAESLGRWFAGGSNPMYGPDSNHVLLKSDDHGATWDLVDNPWDFVTDGAGEITSLAWGDDISTLVAVGSDDGGNPATMSSTDGGATWTQHAQPLDDIIYVVAYLSGVGFVIGGSDSIGAFSLARSPDGATWTGVSTILDGSNVTVVLSSENLGMFFANAGNVCSEIIYSTDMVAWNTATAADDPFNCLMPSSTWFGGRLYVANQYPHMMSTADGITWINEADTPLSQVYRVTATPDQILITDGSQVSFSADAADWSAPVSPGSINDIAYDPVVAKVIAAGGGSPFTIARGTFVTTPTTTGAVAPLWRYLIADLSGAGITDFSKLASDRAVERVLNVPLTMSGTVPSDNPQVYLPYTDDGYDDPYLAEGTRLLWGFRRESNTPPYYTVRAATIVQLIEDEAQQDDARTRFVGFDPWHYLMSRPVVNSAGNLPGVNGLSFTNTQASVVIARLLKWSIDNMGFTYIDAGATYSGTADWEGTLETGAGMVIDINFAQGTSVGQAWRQVVDMGVCDIVLDPVYAPQGRGSGPAYNYLCDLNVYAQAGVIRDEQIFAWNLPGRTLVGLNRQEDGSQRANSVFFRAGQGGAWGDGTIFTDGASSAKFGEYWGQQFMPGVTGPNAVDVVNFLAQQQLLLRANGKETVTFQPAPERSPRPWVDYKLGDRVPVWASQQKFRKVLGETVDGTMAETQYQRIYGWTANISDDALETVTVLTSPTGFTG